MAAKGSSGMDFSAFFTPNWNMSTPLEWIWAERSDKLEEQGYEAMDTMRRTLWETGEKAFEDQVKFIGQRLHANFECARKLAECRVPDETFGTLNKFYADMWKDYGAQARVAAGLIQESLKSGEKMAKVAKEAAAQATATVQEATGQRPKAAPAQPAKAKAKTPNPRTTAKAPTAKATAAKTTAAKTTVAKTSSPQITPTKTTPAKASSAAKPTPQTVKPVAAVKPTPAPAPSQAVATPKPASPAPTPGATSSAKPASPAPRPAQKPGN